MAVVDWSGIEVIGDLVFIMAVIDWRWYGGRSGLGV